MSRSPQPGGRPSWSKQLSSCSLICTTVSLLQLDELPDSPVANTEITEKLESLADDELAGAPVLEVSDDLPDDDTEHHALVSESQHLTQPSVHLACLLHLVSNVNLPELLEEREQSELQLITSSLAESTVSQLNKSGEI